MNRRTILVTAVLAVSALLTGLWLRRSSARPRGERALVAALDRLAARDAEGARRLAEVARAALPDSADAAFVAAAAEAAGGDLRAAYASAEEAAVRAPRDAEKALAAGLVARELARLTGNEAWPERSRTWFEAAVVRAEAAVESAPEATVPRLYAAAARLAAGQPAVALAHLAEAPLRTAAEREQAAVLRASAQRVLDRATAPRPTAAGGDRPPGSPAAGASRARTSGARGEPRGGDDARGGRGPSGAEAAPPPTSPGAAATSPLEARRGIARSFAVFVDDRAAFDAALQNESASTVVDSDGAFAPDPSAATGQSSVTRSGTVDGRGFSYTAYDVDVANTRTGTILPGAAGGDVADTDNVNVERPASQGTATGSGTWGLDGSTGSTTTRNGLLLDFTTTPDGLGIGHFGLDLIDFEASPSFTQGEIRLYDGGVLVFSSLFDWSPSDDGNNRVHFLGVVAVLPGPVYFDQALVVLGDDSAGGGFSEQWAADRITFGRAVANPEPGTWALFGLGAAAMVLAVRRARRVRGAPPPAGARSADRRPQDAGARCSSG